MPKRTGRKFKAVDWPEGVRRKPSATWYVVEVNDLDGSYYPRVGPVFEKYAKEQADKLQAEWRAGGR